MTAEPDYFELVDMRHGQEVILRGRQVPFLEVFPDPDSERVMLVFDHRLGLHLDASNYERITAFVADVMEQCFHPDLGRTFNTVQRISAIESEDVDVPDDPRND